MTGDDLLLEVKGLRTEFRLDEGTVQAVAGVDLQVVRGKTLCVVGESGCGKSVTARSILQIVDAPGRIVGGEILLHRRTADGRRETIDLAKLSPRGREMRAIRGHEIAMVFQEPMTSLSPLHTIGDQITENVLLHFPVSKQEARERAIATLAQVGFPKPADRIDAYPFQLSGGLRQRAMIAMALVCNPSLLIADEPTTALDVTTQAQILELLQRLQAELGMAIMLITHDLGVVAEMADDVAVMYLGIVAERGGVDAIFHDPQHPYTRALLRSIPRLGGADRQRLDTIQGMVPNPFNRPSGCPFRTRCPEMMPGRCDRETPPPIRPAAGREVRCLLYDADGRDPVEAGTGGARGVVR